MAQGRKKTTTKRPAKKLKAIAYSDPDPVEMPPSPKTGYGVDAGKPKPRKPGKKKG